jgi:hypothetical protein
MITDPDGSLVVSSMGWVEGDKIWVLDTSGDAPAVIPLGTGARYASLHSSRVDRFVVAHHFRGKRFELSVRRFADPSHALARAVMSDDDLMLTGDLAAWAGLPLLYVEYLGFLGWQDHVLIRVSPSTERVTVQRLEWYDDSYDKGYQGVTGVLALPDDEAAVITVQRSSRLVLHDLDTGKAKRFIDLANRAGNPELALRTEMGELWATDYDMLLVLRTHDWTVARSVRLQGDEDGIRNFVGGFAFATDGSCIVARPFSGDVVALDHRTLKVRRKVSLGSQPLEVAPLANGEVVARDWKTGRLLRGILKRTWFAG